MLQSDMCGESLEEVIEFHVARGLTELDLKTGLRGESVETLSPSRAASLAAQVDAAGMSVYCLSTSLFSGHLDGDSFWRDVQRMHDLGEVISIVQPRFVRVLSPSRASGSSNASVADYAAAISATARILGHLDVSLLIENGPENNVLASPLDVVSLFDELESVRFIWDVQNMWQSGWFPSPSDMDALAGVTEYVHVKGGRTADGVVPGALEYASSLATASWPVEQIIVAAWRAGVDHLALNPSHGRHDGTTPEQLRDADVEYLTDVLTHLDQKD